MGSPRVRVDRINWNVFWVTTTRSMQCCLRFGFIKVCYHYARSANVLSNIVYAFLNVSPLLRILCTIH